MNLNPSIASVPVSVPSSMPPPASVNFPRAQQVRLQLPPGMGKPKRMTTQPPPVGHYFLYYDRGVPQTGLMVHSFEAMRVIVDRAINLKEISDPPEYWFEIPQPVNS